MNEKTIKRMQRETLNCPMFPSPIVLITRERCEKENQKKGKKKSWVFLIYFASCRHSDWDWPFTSSHGNTYRFNSRDLGFLFHSSLSASPSSIYLNSKNITNPLICVPFFYFRKLSLRQLRISNVYTDPVIHLGCVFFYGRFLFVHFYVFLLYFHHFFIALALDEATGVQYNNVKFFFYFHFVRFLARQTLVKLNTSKNLYETIEEGGLWVCMHLFFRVLINFVR